jgi:hypothetical protein
MLAMLADTRFESFTSLRAALESVVHHPDVVSRRRRAASCLLPAVPVLVGMAMVTLIVGRFSTAAGVPTDLTRWFALQATFSAVLAAMATYLTRGGAVLRWWGIGVAMVTGGNPSRARVVWRTIVAWSPVLACSALVLGAGLHPRQALVSTVLAALVWVLGGVYAVVNPERGIQDRVARTWLVPR